ncbi:MAG: radical SAM protein [Thermotogae bacterium]|nr:radical SAM protein [Thermotogota bacterium]
MMKFKPEKYFRKFDPTRDIHEIASAIENLEAEGEDLGLYVHIPFCKSICPFCPYNKVLHDPELEELYEHYLMKELSFYSDIVRKKFESLYFGGGTPTLMLKTIERIVNMVDVENERAVEYLPNSSPKGDFSALRSMGVNYVSLGIQSLNEDVLRYLKRPHTVEDNLMTLKESRRFFEFVDVDLIFDAVKFDEETVLMDVRKLFEFDVDQISLYPLMRFGYTPFGKGKHDRKKEHEILRKVEEIAENYGYRRTSVWTFGKSRDRRYTSITREFYVGIGAGSASYLKEVFCVNGFNLNSYLKMVEESCVPVFMWKKLGRFDSMLFHSFWRFYTGELDLKRIMKKFGSISILMGIFTIILSTIGFARIKDRKCILTSKGFNVFHDIERHVTYKYIEPLWKYMLESQ